ncbi:MAG TPA: CaiB/BaiF CoA-transferase family protein [Parvularculaceae bacterium]|nr:CaiB/BaiF CoA-transferase family protein [Parvularculaceae bacterium]
MAILSGVRVIEFEGLGPGPFCGMLLADLGAEVILIERPGSASGPAAIFRRGKKSITLDLKKEGARQAALRLVERADALIEGLRPGVMERLGLGPDEARAVNKRIVYGRLTGWGQDGPLAPVAGHDLNYIGLSGAAWYAGRAGEAPFPPPTLVGDIGGGALYLAIGILAGVLNARESGEGCVVDAAIVDGSAHMMTLLHAVRASGGAGAERGSSLIDGAHFYDVYQCADGAWISVGPLEPKFYAMLLEKLGLSEEPLFTAQYNQPAWPEAKQRLAEIFAAEPRDYWRELLEGTDVCFAPILSPTEAAEHPHMKARGVYREIDGVLQAAAAPRFNSERPADPSAPVKSGAHTAELLAEIGMMPDDIA